MVDRAEEYNDSSAANNEIRLAECKSIFADSTKLLQGVEEASNTQENLLGITEATEQSLLNNASANFTLDGSVIAQNTIGMEREDSDHMEQEASDHSSAANNEIRLAECKSIFADSTKLLQGVEEASNTQENLLGITEATEQSLLNNASANFTLDGSVIAQNTIGMEREDSDHMEETENSVKDIEDSLALSPTGALTGSFVLNGNNVSTHTFRKTEWDVKKLENYVRMAYGDSTPMENMEPITMNRYLKSFFELAKKSDGMDYEPESLIGFMNSFERYLKTKNYPESLLRSETFKDSRTVLKKKRDLVRSIGKLIRTKTKDTCYLLQFHRNLLKEKGLLNRDNPDCLLAEIYLNNMIYFGEFLKEDKAWRGNLNLVWGDMLLERDSQNGLEYLTLATYAKKSNRTPGQQGVRTNVRTKTGTQTSKLRAAAAAAAAAAASSHNAVNLIDSPRVYARQPLAYCPIEAYKIYRSRRPNNCLDRDSPFYLAPLFKSKNQSKIWYKALAMSCQRLDALFYCLFKKAGVDLTSLASMSQQQQQQAVATAASMVNNDQNNSVSLQLSPGAQWKSFKDDEQDLMLMNGNVGPSKSIIDTNYQQANSGISYFNPQTGQQHIITTVPAQVQVQVQIQVQLPLHQQQIQSNNAANQQNNLALNTNNGLNSTSNSAVALLA
jgi:hypothetical protein